MIESVIPAKDLHKKNDALSEASVCLAVILGLVMQGKISNLQIAELSLHDYVLRTVAKVNEAQKL